MLDILDQPTATAWEFGAAMDTIADTDGDGIRELVVDSPADNTNLSSQGAARLLTGRILATPATVGTGCGAGPFLPVLGTTQPVVGQSVTVAGQNAPASALGFVLIALPAATPFNLGGPG